MQKHVRPTGELTFALTVLAPALVASVQGIQSLLHRRPRKPTPYSVRTELDKQPFSAVLDRGKPTWLVGDLRGLLPWYWRAMYAELRWRPTWNFFGYTNTGNSVFSPEKLNVKLSVEET